MCGSGGSSAAVKLASTRLPSPKALVSSPSQILQIPKAQQTVQSVSPKGMQASSSQSASAAAGAKPTFQIKQESGEHTRQQIKHRAAPLKGFSHWTWKVAMMLLIQNNRYSHHSRYEKQVPRRSVTNRAVQSDLSSCCCTKGWAWWRCFQNQCKQTLQKSILREKRMRSCSLSYLRTDLFSHVLYTSYNF